MSQGTVSAGPPQAFDMAPVMALMNAMTNYETAHYLRAAAELKIADQLLAGPRSAADLAPALGADPDGLLRFLRACAAMDLLTENGDGTFGLTATGYLLRSESMLYGLARNFSGAHFNRVYERVADTVRTGQPAAEAALGMSFFEFLKANPDKGEHFEKMMSFMSANCGRMLAAAYDLSGYQRIVDLGGGHGILLSQLLEAAPGATGVLADRPEVLAQAGPMLAAGGLGDRIELAPGDFFAEVPADGDLYTIKTVFLDWDDEHVSRLLANVAKVARPGATVLVIDWLYPETVTPDAGPAELDFVNRMRTMNFWLLLMNGGAIRTRTHVESLLAGAGFATRGVFALGEPPNRWDVVEARLG